MIEEIKSALSSIDEFIVKTRDGNHANYSDAHASVDFNKILDKFKTLFVIKSSDEKEETLQQRFDRTFAKKRASISIDRRQVVAASSLNNTKKSEFRKKSHHEGNYPPFYFTNLIKSDLDKKKKLKSAQEYYKDLNSVMLATKKAKEDQDSYLKKTGNSFNYLNYEKVIKRDSTYRSGRGSDFVLPSLNRVRDSTFVKGKITNFEELLQGLKE